MTKLAITKGIALLTVLVVLLVVVALAEGILQIMLNQSRLTHHNVSRIQAYYAAMAGMKLAYENLRTNSWPLPNPASAYRHYMCQSVTPQCPPPVDANPIIEPRLPGAIQFVIVRVASRNASCNDPADTVPPAWPGGLVCNPPAGVDICVNARAVYTYQ